MTEITNSEGTTNQLKADFFPMTVLKLSQCDLTAIAKQLDDAKATAPKYFAFAPLVIDIHNLGPLKTELDIKGLCELLRQRDMIPVGIRGLEKKQQSVATDNGLALLQSGMAKPTKEKPQKSPEAPPPPPPPPQSSAQPTAQLATKIITKPIRAGTRVYAKGGDLIVLAAVNAGAECIADGNIHIHGPLRGRALAGANGDETARIFCRSIEAELVSIAGHYLMSEQITSPRGSKTKPMIQIYLSDQKLKIETF